jgi:hypothetical protein
LKRDIVLFPNIWFHPLFLKKDIHGLVSSHYWKKKKLNWISLSGSFVILFSRCGLDIFLSFM